MKQISLSNLKKVSGGSKKDYDTLWYAGNAIRKGINNLIKPFRPINVK
ncbi:hypothetical protein [Companilactobacillus insicii]|nr:hypothetical protein [Companilactobacillus insicii]